jgi:iron only hydrogenase large subunit-like protein/nitrogen-specific signal transduction histidine kinase
MIPVFTVGDICKKCYSCVRTCPTKAIEVHGGQANIIEHKCIACGNCVAMCSQRAKRVVSSVEQTLEFLKQDDAKVFALLAPSFPAAFLDVEPDKLLGAVRACGFDGLFEVAFGADLVSYRYHQLYKSIDDPTEDFMISSPCPAVVSFVEKIYPNLVPHLAPSLSPMEAMARVIRDKIDPGAKIVFIGPCVAKKSERTRLKIVDAVLTFSELTDLFDRQVIEPGQCVPSDFDPPHSNLGKIYPLTGGLLKAADIDSDIIDSPVYVVEGAERVRELLKVLSTRVKNGESVVNKFFDLLFCEGCIAGPEMPNTLSHYERKKYIVQFMKNRSIVHNIEEWASSHEQYLDVDLSKSFYPAEKVDYSIPEEEIERILAMTDKHSPEDELNCRACGYESCREKAQAVYRGIAEVEMCLPFLISKLEKTVLDVKENQMKLLQAEKLASMGQMAAGIAHEINNPLGVVLMYSHLLKDEVDESSGASKDLDRIISEAERTRKIVQGILNFAREEKIDRRSIAINELVREACEEIVSGNNDRFDIVYDFDVNLGEHLIDPGQLKQVFHNIVRNAMDIMSGGGPIRIRTREGEDEFTVKIMDSGPGIPEEHLTKIFSPFFTTKPVGKGTGLGLPVCYGIVKMHEGTIRAGNNPDRGAFFEMKIKHHRAKKFKSPEGEFIGTN